MSYWICPLKGEYPIVVEAETHEAAKEQMKSLVRDGGQVIAIPIDFYAKLCKTGAVDAALLTFRGGQLA